MVLATSSALSSQVRTPAPVPTEFRTAKTAFVSNTGNDRAYLAFYKTLLAWNQYAIALNTAAADLVVEISYGVDDSAVNNGSSTQSPYLNLVTRDVKTTIPLWSLTEPLGSSTSDKDFAARATKLVSDLNRLFVGEMPS